MKIGLIGRVADGIDLFDGQTIKTRNLKRLLCEIDNTEVYIVDTYNYKKRFFQVLYNTFIALKTCDKIVISISINGRKFFFPFLYYVNKLFNKDIYHSLIGGRLVLNIKEHPRWIKYVRSFSANWVESKEIVEDLSKLGIKNGVYFPNFKYIKELNKNELVYTKRAPYKYCMFCRIQKQKGVLDAIQAIKAVNQAAGKIIAILELYGPIDSDFCAEFNDSVAMNKEYVCYMGCVDANQSVPVIKEYFAMLFPTQYYNEGIPGSIVDSLISGVPIISRKWHYCDEMLQDGYTGYVYDFEKPWLLKDLIRKSIDECDSFNNFKVNCLAEGKKYLPEKAKKIIQNSFKQ